MSGGSGSGACGVRDDLGHLLEFADELDDLLVLARERADDVSVVGASVGGRASIVRTPLKSSDGSKRSWRSRAALRLAAKILRRWRPRGWRCRCVDRWRVGRQRVGRRRVGHRPSLCTARRDDAPAAVTRKKSWVGWAVRSGRVHWACAWLQRARTSSEEVTVDQHLHLLLSLRPRELLGRSQPVGTCARGARATAR